MGKRWGIWPGGPFVARFLRDERGTMSARVTWLALLAGLLLRAFFVRHHAQFGGDALVYGDLARNLRLRHIFGFTQDDGIRPTLIRLPGYPLFLAACFTLFGEGNYLAVLWVQVTLDLLTCLLLARLAARLFGSGAGMATLWVAVLCPFTANYAAFPITECLTLFCITLAFYSLDRWLAYPGFKRWPLILGVALAFAVLQRPDRGLLAAAILPAMLWIATRNGLSARRLLPVLTATLVLLLPLALWGARNWHVFHTFQPLAPRYANDPGEPVPLGFQRWYRTWAIDFKSTVDTYWTYDASLMSLAALPPRAFDSASQRAATQALFDTYNATTSASPALDAGFATLASDRIAAHPVRFYLLLPAARVLDMFLRPRTELMALPIDWWKFPSHPGASTFELAYALLNAAYLALALVGLYRWSAQNFRPLPPLAAAMLAFVALRILLLLTLDNSEPRYTLDLFPVILLLAGTALSNPQTHSNPHKKTT